MKTKWRTHKVKLLETVIFIDTRDSFHCTWTASKVTHQKYVYKICYASADDTCKWHCRFILKSNKRISNRILQYLFGCPTVRYSLWFVINFFNNLVLLFVAGKPQLCHPSCAEELTLEINASSLINFIFINFKFWRTNIRECKKSFLGLYVDIQSCN